VARKPPLQEEITDLSVMRFLPFTTTEVLHTNAQRQLLNCLHATTLKVGLLLHFGPQPRLFRLVAPNTTCRQ